MHGIFLSTCQRRVKNVSLTASLRSSDVILDADFPWLHSIFLMKAVFFFSPKFCLSTAVLSRNAVLSSSWTLERIAVEVCIICVLATVSKWMLCLKTQDCMWCLKKSVLQILLSANTNRSEIFLFIVWTSIYQKKTENKYTPNKI